MERQKRLTPINNETPTDWRRPDYIDRYNRVMHAASKENGVQYIDNNAQISGVAWDSASGWVHYDPKVMNAIVMNTFYSLV